MKYILYLECECGHIKELTIHQAENLILGSMKQKLQYRCEYCNAPNDVKESIFFKKEEKKCL